MPQMTAVLSAYCSSDEYRTKLKATGHDVTETFELDGTTYTHDDVAAVWEQAYQRHASEYRPRCGARDRVNERIKRQYDKACKDDVKQEFHISLGTVIFAVVLGILGGPAGLILAICTCLFEWKFEHDLDGE